MVALQWEPQIIAVAVMYLAGCLCKFDIQDWTAKQSSQHCPLPKAKATKLPNIEPPPPNPPPPDPVNPDHKLSSSYPPAPDLPSKPTPAPLPLCSRPPPRPPMDLPSSSSLVSNNGYQKLQSTMKTEGSCYTTLPQACALPLGYHPYPPGPTSYYTAPVSAYSYLLAPPHPSVMGMAPNLSSGYPLPSTAGHNQLLLLLPECRICIRIGAKKT
ncbi:cyclin-K-like protein [Lates japonicus]|uniref:Cyclin-K-like protein n=1 Tax=Lates japonicus TaxID=270547 RepID=A0AAD3NGL2_LATJO|nr:cyclin-K-like protein [Lates japonicus]